MAYGLYVALRTDVFTYQNLVLYRTNFQRRATKSSNIVFKPRTTDPGVAARALKPRLPMKPIPRVSAVATWDRQSRSPAPPRADARQLAHGGTDAQPAAVVR